ncbi:MAG: hypothetical protein ACRD03_13560 [Acidimicrobiales bacterium]
MRRWGGHGLVVAPALALLHVVVGFLAPTAGTGSGLLAPVRLVLAAASSVALVFGPGLALWAAARSRGRSFPLALLAVPGPALLAATGLLCWWAAPGWDPSVVAAVVLVPALAVLLGCAVAPPLRVSPGDHARRALVVAMVVLAIGAAKGTWSPGPPGELYGGTVSRTLEVGQRSDSRISFHVVQLVAHGTSPYSDVGRAYFHPWSFSDRGPLAGLVTAPLVLISGASVPQTMPDQPWSPFDREGFAAYRLAMSALAVSCLTALFGLVARLRGSRTGLLAVLLAALTPFVVHEVYFTWPKLFAAGLVLASAVLVLERRPGLAGLLVGAAYLVHPMALLSLPSLGLLWVLVRWPPVWRAPLARTVAGLAAMALAVALSLGAWRAVNGDEYRQDGFAGYALSADGQRPGDPGAWAAERARSVLNTLVPLHLVLVDGEHRAVNSVAGPSPGVVRFFLQYWTGVPFGMGLLALPILVARLGAAARRWSSLFAATAVVPFLVFAGYWGADRTGLLREGMHVWVLTLVALAAAAVARRHGAPAPASRFEAAAWSLRAVEVAAMMVVPAAVAGDGLYRRAFLRTDLMALAVMAAGTWWLARQSYALLRSPPVAVASPQAADELRGVRPGGVGAVSS